MKKIFLSLALAVGLTATAAETTFDFVGQDYGLTRESGNSSNYLSNGTTINNDGVSIVLNNLGTGDTNWRLWKDGLRATKAVKGEMTISVPNGTITGVSVSIANNATSVSYNGADAVSIAKGASYSWEEESEKAVLLFTQTGTMAVSSLTVTYTTGSTPVTGSGELVKLNITPVWVNGIENGVANPIPGPDGSWGKPTATNNGGKTVCRFAVGRDGKILMNDHVENAIMAWDGKEMTTYAKLPAVTATSWDGNNASPADGKWNGTAITTDDAGNVIYDYCFIDPVRSLKYWGVVAADGTITDVELSTPLEDLGVNGRLDILGHIVGDVNSAKGGIGYATTPSSNNVLMFHFKGDGKKVTSLTAKSFEVPGLASNGLYIPSPKYLTVDELMANGTPEKEFYVPYGSLNSAPVLGGYLASGDEILEGYGNRQYNTSAVFALGGRKFIVRSYVTPDNPNLSKLTGWRGVMTFGIFDLETSICVASWQDSEYSNYYGMGNITAEPVDNNTVNIYTYIVTGSKDDNNPAVVPGAYGGMFTVTVTDEIIKQENGTEKYPYIISTPQDLVNMNSMLRASGYTYFEFAEDIDMAGVAYVAPATSAVANVHINGNNHVIKNLTIATGVNPGNFHGALFAQMNGSVKNLGFENVDLTCSNWGGCGAIAGYIAASEPSTIENCFVTGKLHGPNAQLGSFACGNYYDATITNCYSSATLETVDGGIQGGFVGAIMYTKSERVNTLTINNSYFAGTINGATAGGFAGANQSYGHPAVGTEVLNLNNCALLSAKINGKACAATANAVGGTLTINTNNVMIGDKTTVKGEAVADAMAQGEIVKTIMGWEGFNATQVDATTGLPIFAWQTGVEKQHDGTADDPFVIATAEDLCNAYKLVQGGEYWFKQTADIDMADVKDYHALAGYNGDYSSTIHYDGQNHLIKNFSPEDAPMGGDKYYCTSLFGVAAGEISNLGVVDADVVTAQGSGIIAAYGGFNLTYPLMLSNVFVTGNITGTGGYTGGMIGTTGNNVNFDNCYANVNVIGGSNVAGLIGRTRNETSLVHVYVAGTVEGNEPYLVLGSTGNSNSYEFDEDGVIAFNTGAEKATPDNVKPNMWSSAPTIATAATEADLIAKVKGWKAYSETKTVYGLPGLAAFDYTAVKAIVANSVKETLALASKTTFTVNYELTVGYVNGKNVFACDAEGDFIQLYGANTLKVGNVIPAGWEATYELYNNVTPELTGFTLPAVTEGTFTAKEVAAADINNDLVNSVVMIKNVTLDEATPSTKDNFTGKVGDIELSFRNNYTLPSVEAGNYNITVVVTVFNGAPSLYVVNYEAVPADGTKEHPFVIATVEDLCNAYLKIKANMAGVTYFVQTADIDMAGVKDWHAINGFNGTYTAAFSYDGQNHLIKNFSPEVTAPDAAKDNYYMGTIFGVLSGEVKNLGIVDANVKNDQQGGGFLAAYIGHSNSKAVVGAEFDTYRTYIQNVFVTGTYDATGNTNYVGGLAGTTGSMVTIEDCFVNAEIKAENNVAGLVGRLRDELELTRSYVAGTVSGTGANVALAVASDKTPLITTDGVYAFNTGAAAAVVGAMPDDPVIVVTSANEAEAIAKITSWKAFSAEKTVYGLPGLESFDYTAELDIQDGTAAHPYKIATAEDLCNAYLKVKEGTTYFVQTADIDMEGVTKYHAIVGNNGGGYNYKINYDGQYHLIKNFAPEDRPAMEDNGYYCTSIFGVASGYIKHLGVVDAKVVTAQGAGILAAYAGHSTGDFLQLEKVFVTGEVTGTGSYTGGMFGCTGNELTLYNCFANVKVNGSKLTGGIVGRANNFVSMDKVYVAGTVASAQTPYLVMNTSAAGEFDGSNVYAFNTGADEAMPSSIELWGDEVKVTSANDAAAIAKIAGWSAFSDVNTVYGLPGLAGFDYSVADALVVNSIAETIELANNTTFTVNYELTVGFVNYSNVFARDAQGDFIQLYGQNTLKVGDVIPAGWEATYELYNGVTPELKNFTLPEVSEGVFEADAVEAADVDATLVNHVITVKNVEFDAATPSTKSNFTGVADGVELTFRNNYTLESVEAGKYDVTVVVNIYQGNVQLYVVKYTKPVATGIDEIEADDAEAVYYNLQGVRVENPESGLYIRVRGNKVDKVVK